MAQGYQRPGKHSRQASRIATRFNTSTTQESKGETSPTSGSPDQATIAFVKHVLCSGPSDRSVSDGDNGFEVDSQPLGELLPPLTSSNEIDVQLYALIAVILNLFVQAWYNKITPDQDFAGETVQIIAHCTRGLEQRLRNSDLEAFIFDELPELLEAHIEGTKTTRTASRFSVNSPDKTSARAIFHSLHPHSALTPVPDDMGRCLEQDANETLWSQLMVSKVLQMLLPPEDLRNPCLNVLVSEIFAETVVHRGVCGKACESWLIWEGVTKLIYFFRPELAPQPNVDTSPSRLEQFGLLSSAAESTAKHTGQNTGRSIIDSASAAFWSLLQGIMLTWLLARTFFAALSQASSLASRTSQFSDHEAAGEGALGHGRPNAHPPRYESGGAYVPPHTTKPIVGMQTWPFASSLVLFQQRMPWLSGVLSLLQWLLLFGPGRLCRVDSAMDRLLSEQIHKRILNPELLPPLLRALRSTLFPANALAPARVPPTAEEVLEIKHECARVVVEAVPAPLRTRFFATHDLEAMKTDVEGILDLFGDSYINKHLVVSAVDLLVVRLFPELGGEGRP